VIEQTLSRYFSSDYDPVDDEAHDEVIVVAFLNISMIYIIDGMKKR